ncbi:hypothetical protein N781_13805 [Pontibacillus halophilus JSM 076056 = DSM 19796]|uniref:HTH gntR-type domain-containing protein n=1 Tax=Pontibacillus halophilus JSM 076056 = DSM 19796 TaxID=1385510 RepID=A0A0A5GM72_9BACI|nr:GntR family transcriptional regulator [Pontibacillus halophilus]KGX93054.1 hypothetical protein N781_13805 [Pontibacillus halophilus JSM 076056 = DSM 19796]
MSERTSMIHKVYEAIKEAILFRRLAPGTQLVEQVISLRLEVSRTPIRHALKQLEQEGLVTIIPNRGAFVVQPTLAEIHQAFEIRKELEQMAARLSVHSLEEPDFEEMRRLIKQEKESYTKDSLMNYIEVNNAFHMYLAEKSGNSFLQDYMKRLLNQIDVYLMLYDIFYDVDMKQSDRFKEHEHIVQALEQKDLPRVYELLERHMEISINNMYVEKQTYHSLEDEFM